MARHETHPLGGLVGAGNAGRATYNHAMTSRFSKEQKEGLARFIDAIAAASFVGAVVGATGHSPLSGLEIGVLFVACPILLTFSWILRKPT
jgi:hypothetical protein